MKLNRLQRMFVNRAVQGEVAHASITYTLIRATLLGTSPNDQMEAALDGFADFADGIVGLIEARNERRGFYFRDTLAPHTSLVIESEVRDGKLFVSWHLTSSDPKKEIKARWDSQQYSSEEVEFLYADL